MIINKARIRGIVLEIRNVEHPDEGHNKRCITVAEAALKEKADSEKILVRAT